MTALARIWDDLERPLHDAPRFQFEAPDGRKDWTEIARQVEFRRLMKMRAPRVYVRANPNAGKRNPFQASREGIVGGVFDMSAFWTESLCAEVEFKGYDKSGRAGKLSQAQIDHGNRMTDLGYPVAMFFDPVAAVDWLRGLGFPIRAATL